MEEDDSLRASDINLNKDVFIEEEKNLNQRKKKKKLDIIGGSVLLGVIIVATAVALYFILTKDSKKSSPEPKKKPRSLIDPGLLDKYETPYYYYNTTLLNDTINKVVNLSILNNLKVHFSLKSNFNEKIVKIIASHKEIGADCVSGGEVNFALKHFEPNKIVFAGIGKTYKEIENAVEKGIFCINVESFEELEILNEICENKQKKMNFATRINPNIVAHTDEKIITGSNENKFGIYIDDPKMEEKFYDTINDVYFNKDKKYSYLNFIGLHFHIGSQILNFTDFSILCKKIDKMIEKLNELNISISYLNLGGGLGVDYEEPELHPMADFEGYFNTYLTNITSLKKIGPDFNNNKNITLHFELGRSMIAQSGYLISKVIYIKDGVNKKFAILDAGMNDLIRPAMYGAVHKIERVEINDDPVMYDVVGPICESSDVFAKNFTLDRLSRDDYVLIRTAGAYGESMASRYNYREIPKGYLDFEFY